MENLKDLVRGDLKTHNEQEREKRVKENKNLKEVTAYSVENPSTKALIQDLKNEGIKIVEKDLNIYNEIKSIVQIRTQLVLVVNGHYLVHSRDFNNTKQCVDLIKHFANPDFVSPSFEDQVLQSLKNLQFGMSRSIGTLSRQLQPVIKILTDLAKEDQEEDATKKNN